MVDWKREKKETFTIDLIKIIVQVSKNYKDGKLNKINVEKVYLESETERFSYKPFKYVNKIERDDLTGWELFENTKELIELKDLPNKLNDLRKLLEANGILDITFTATPLIKIDDDGNEETYYQLSYKDIDEIVINK